MRGWQDRAMDFYFKAITIDPYYLPAYTNLAALYEERGDLKTAAKYWQKRVKLGLPDDAWTKKARLRLENIGFSVEEVARELQEGDVLDLIKDVTTQSPQPLPLTKEARDRRQKALEYLNSARLKLQRGNISAALDDLGVAAHLDPTNEQIDIVVEEIRKKIKDTESR
jgi:tetratricopeptide (TPR) repeat protein